MSMTNKVRLNIEIEKELLANFKIWCVRQNTNMSKVIITHIEEILK